MHVNEHFKSLLYLRSYVFNVKRYMIIYVIDLLFQSFSRIVFINGVLVRRDNINCCFIASIHICAITSTDAI